MKWWCLHKISFAGGKHCCKQWRFNLIMSHNSQALILSCSCWLNKSRMVVAATKKASSTTIPALHPFSFAKLPTPEISVNCAFVKLQSAHATVRLFIEVFKKPAEKEWHDQIGPDVFLASGITSHNKHDSHITINGFLVFPKYGDLREDLNICDTRRPTVEYLFHCFPNHFAREFEYKYKYDYK